MTPIELRERVAREVMGFVEVESVGMRNPTRYLVAPGAVGWVEAKGFLRNVPHYESDIAAAFQVVEEMRSRCRRLRLIQTDNGAWFAEFAPVRLGQPYKTGVSDLVAATAISLAALAALEDK